MRLKIDLEIPSWTKWLAGGIAIGLVLGLGAWRVYANVPNTFNPGDKVTAKTMNDNFTALDTRVTALENPVDCQVRLRGIPGYGITNRKVPRFTNTDESCADLGYVDDPAAGATITLRKPGLYAITFGAGLATGQGYLTIAISANATGIEINQPQAATVLDSAHLLARAGDAFTAGNLAQPLASWTGYLAAGTVVHPLVDHGSATTGLFSISRIR